MFMPFDFGTSHRAGKQVHETYMEILRRACAYVKFFVRFCI